MPMSSTMRIAVCKTSTDQPRQLGTNRAPLFPPPPLRLLFLTRSTPPPAPCPPSFLRPFHPPAADALMRHSQNPILAFVLLFLASLLQYVELSSASLSLPSSLSSPPSLSLSGRHSPPLSSYASQRSSSRPPRTRNFCFAWLFATKKKKKKKHKNVFLSSSFAAQFE